MLLAPPRPIATRHTIPISRNGYTPGPQHHTTPCRDAQILPHHIHHAMATTPIPFHSMPNNQQQPIRIHTHTQTPLKAMPPTTHHKQYAHAATTHTPRIDKRHQGRAMLQSASLTKNKKRTKRKNLHSTDWTGLDQGGCLSDCMVVCITSIHNIEAECGGVEKHLV